jgi:hypothetical protein
MSADMKSRDPFPVPLQEAEDMIAQGLDEILQDNDTQTGEQAMEMTTEQVAKGLWIDLDEETAKTLGEYLGDGERPITFSVGPGHAGYGLYAHDTEYPEEGATFVTAIAAPSASTVNQPSCAKLSRLTIRATWKCNCASQAAGLRRASFTK